MLGFLNLKILDLQSKQNPSGIFLRQGVGGKSLYHYTSPLAILHFKNKFATFFSQTSWWQWEATFWLPFDKSSRYCLPLPYSGTVLECPFPLPSPHSTAALALLRNITFRQSSFLLSNNQKSQKTNTQKNPTKNRQAKKADEHKQYSVSKHIQEFCISIKTEWNFLVKNTSL